MIARAALAMLVLSTVGTARSHRSPPPLRVCADPNNLPFSNDQQAGFENRIALLMARDMGTTAEFSWRPQMRGFVRKGLKAGACDVYVGVPVSYGPLLTTNPYYRSTYVIVYRAQRPGARALARRQRAAIAQGRRTHDRRRLSEHAARASARRARDDRQRARLSDRRRLFEAESAGAHPRGARARRDRRRDRVGAVRGLLREARAITTHHRAAHSSEGCLGADLRLRHRDGCATHRHGARTHARLAARA